MMRVVFMGSAGLACPSLDALLKDSQVDLLSVVTQPDRPKGRGRRLAACDVKRLASDRNVNIMVPQDVNSQECIRQLESLAPDLIVVVAYGQILKSCLLEIPSLGCINIHASLLPRYRGAAPVQWALINGETVSGVTAMYVDAGMDTGDIISSVEVGIMPEDTAGTLHDKLAVKGAELLLGTVHSIMDGNVSRIPQDNAKATYAPKLSRADAEIDWSMPACDVMNRIRGFNPWPGSWSALATDGSTRTIKVFRAVLDCLEGEPGTVLDISAEGPIVAAGDKSLRLVEVQPDGGRIMSGADYLLGHRVGAGDKFVKV